MPAKIEHETLSTEISDEIVRTSHWDQPHSFTGMWTEDNFDPDTKADVIAVDAALAGKANVVDVTNIHVGTSAPSNPATGDLWVDTN